MERMKRFFRGRGFLATGGYVAGFILVAFGIAAIVMGTTVAQQSLAA
jgi:hypothetical protein